MKKNEKSDELLEYRRVQAAEDNFMWFSALSPGQKIYLLERTAKDVYYLRTLKENAEPRQ